MPFLIASSRCWRTLNFVDDGSIQAPNEAGRIGLGGFENRLIIKGDIGSAGFSHLSNKCSLAGPARAYDEIDRSIQKGFLRPLFYKPFERASLESRTIGTIVLS